MEEEDYYDDQEQYQEDEYEEGEEVQFQGENEYIPKEEKKEYMSRQQIAGSNLYKELESYPQINLDERNSLRNKYVNMPSLPVLNMRVLAAVLVFLKLVENKVTKNTMSGEIFKEVFSILNNALGDDKDQYRELKTKATFVRYIFAVLKFSF